MRLYFNNTVTGIRYLWLLLSSSSLSWYLENNQNTFIVATTTAYSLRTTWRKFRKKTTLQKNQYKNIFSFPVNVAENKRVDNQNNSIQVDTDTTAAVDSFFMEQALIQAEKAAKAGEVPIGALVVKPVPVSDIKDTNKMLGTSGNDNNDSNTTTTYYQVLSRAYNQVEQLHDASAHAEMLAMRKAATFSNKANVANWRLLNTTLYTTVEPCVMCLSAAQAFRIRRIVYGAPDIRLGAIDTYINLLDIVEHPFHTIHNVTKGIYQNESSTLLKAFFQKRRKEKIKERLMSSNSSIGSNKSKWKSLLRKLWTCIRTNSATSGN